jgi:DNA-binding NtrC family response regulator
MRTLAATMPELRSTGPVNDYFDQTPTNSDVQPDFRDNPVLIVDDEPFVADLLQHWVTNVWDYPSIIATTGEEAIILMREKNPRMVLLDINLPDINGIDVLRAIKSADEHLPVVMISAQESITTAVEALKAGAYDYLTKPIDTERLQILIRNATAAYSYQQKLRALQSELNSRYDFSNIISADPRMHDLFKMMRKAVTSDITVLILGESGTGKELVARALHANGPRKEKPFQVVNCAAIPHELLESELFGHEKGSFTGAQARKIGKFEAAHGGTLFLDEIGDMDLTLQAKLLRAIQEREFERVGGTESIRVDVRIVCATNAELREAIIAKRFREDLYYRISTFPINLPPLRERKGDILLLSDHFLKRFGNRQSIQGVGNTPTKISSQAAQAMQQYEWPGNIRELESTIERAVLLAEGEAIQLTDLPLPVRMNAQIEDELANSFDVKDFFNAEQNKSVLPLEELKQLAVRHALEACSGNISEASTKLDISRSTMYRLLEIYNIRSENGKALVA